jgi:formylglycine-generating enzyme required for sulfatase activity
VNLVATAADALHYAHREGFVHRDIKPGNLLLDTAGKLYVADFGLALREEEFGKGEGFAGTPSYMSPEQARGEGHRVDGRTDIFSLGVVLYELLTGRRPFRADSQAELLHQIATVEPRPPRQVNDAIPRELERICLKCLAKRASERFTTARDLADDLRHFLEQAPATSTSAAPVRGAEAAPATPSPPVTPTPPPAVKIIPKGLRSFDAHDADFFQELLPGPRDRDGLPDGLRFWKTRIEETDGDQTFAVGLLYGPSGCGKSSLVKAGLLPRLAKSVRAVYVEATADETEARLLKGLRKACPDLPADRDLTQTLAALRRGHGLPPSQKALLVLDQFEQWLHVRRDEENPPLVQALRQCDGSRVQALVMVRDDFWMAATRFLRALEVRLIEGDNTAAVDLFELPHARKVLAGFGRAFGQLPDNVADLTPEQQQFLDQAVAGLAQEGKVICVRLALFAEMVKGKPWTPATLKAVGGTEGVGVTFLEETFSAATAPPEHRLHQQAARAVLKALLPEQGADIKGHLRAREELLEVSGYGRRPGDFDDLLRILDRQTRLVTPTDPDDSWDKRPRLSEAEDASASQFYQLTHDYLVPALRAWLTRKQKETRRGRAELRLAERAALWQAKPQNRHLPAWWEWLNIRLFTRRQDWTASQTQMMQKARRFHVTRGLVLAACLTLLGLATWDGIGRHQAHRYRDRLLDARTDAVPDVVADMAPWRLWMDPLLRAAYAEAARQHDARKQLYASLALLSRDPLQAEYLVERLLAGTPEEVAVIRSLLAQHRDQVEGRFWTALANRTAVSERWFRAACALALFNPDDERWAQVGADIAVKLVSESSLVSAQWTELLRPAGRWLLPTLAGFIQDDQRPLPELRTLATLYGTLAAGDAGAIARLEERLTAMSDPGASTDAKVAHARRQARAAAALVVMGRPDRVWPLLKASPDPTVRSYLIEWLAATGADHRVLAARLKQEPDVSIRRALVLSLGQFGPDRLPLSDREVLVPYLASLYQEEPDAGIHGAAEWLLRQWHQEARLQAITKGLATGQIAGKRQWYINGQGQTMIVIPRPTDEVSIGKGDERQQPVLNRSFAIASTEVTVAQFLAFRNDHRYSSRITPNRDCPMIDVSWYDAAAYCNWLSAREEIPKDQWCYEPNAAGQYAEGMKIKGGYWKLTGYRLPTEAEWEYACRAGSRTTWSCGAAAALLEKYAWYDRNSLGTTHGVAALKPNDWGLFDMQGNVWEWCQDRSEARGMARDKDHNDSEEVQSKDSRVLRGGSFFLPAANASPADRNMYSPAFRLDGRGFRPARTLTAE